MIPLIRSSCLSRNVLLAVIALAGAALAVWLLLSRGGGGRPGRRLSADATPATAVAPETSPRAAAGAPGAAPARDKAAAAALRQRVADARARRRAESSAPAPRAIGGGAAPADDAPPDPTLAKDYIRDQIHELLPLLEECYTQALERQPNLAGKLVVKFVIAGEPGVGGVVDSSQIDEGASTITDPEMNECVQETMYAAQFVAPAAGGTVSVTYPFAFATDGPPADAGAKK